MRQGQGQFLRAGWIADYNVYDNQLFPLTVGLRTWYMSATIGNGGAALFNVIVAGSLVAIVPLIIAFLMLQRYWRGGLTIGAVK